MFGLFGLGTIVFEIVEEFLEITLVGALQLSGFFVSPVSPFFHGRSSLVNSSRSLSVAIAVLSDTPSG